MERPYKVGDKIIEGNIVIAIYYCQQCGRQEKVRSGLQQYLPQTICTCNPNYALQMTKFLPETVNVDHFKTTD